MNFQALPVDRDRHHTLTLYLAALVLATLLAATDVRAQTPVSPLEFLGGEFSGIARYRFDDYDQATMAGTPISGVGKGSTLRLDIRYTSAVWEGFSFLVEGNGVWHLGDAVQYRIPTDPNQNHVGYPTINDPAVIDFHQLELLWTIPDSKVKLKAGRDELQLNNGRFLGYSPWRQNPQTVDLVGISVPIVDGITFSYDYFDRVHRTTGKDATDGALDMHSHLANATWGIADEVNASAYALLVDYARPDQWVNSTKTFGLRLTGPYKLSHDWGIVYTADYADQSNFGRNPNHVSVPYWDFELGGAYRGESLFGGWTVLGAKNATDKLTTPLSPPMNGWVEKFGPTPSTTGGYGLDARYVTLTGPTPGLPGVTHTVTYYDYFADSSSLHFGNELDFGLEWKATQILKNLMIGARCGEYRADHLYSHSVRSEAYTAYTF